MDRRVIFFLVFIITLVSTALVSGVCLLTKQPALDTVLYSVITMWVMGIVSQLLLQNLYQAIVKPLEQEQIMANQSQATSQLDLEEVEEIDQASEMIKSAKASSEKEQNIPQELSPPTVGVHVEQKG